MTQDEVLFEGRGVRLTLTEAQLEGSTYPVERITRIRTSYRAPSLVRPVLLGAAGILALCFAALSAVLFLALGEQGMNVGFLEGFVIVGLAGALVTLPSAVVSGLRLRGRHLIVIDTEGGVCGTWSTGDAHFAAQVRKALSDALDLHSESVPTALIMPL